MVPRLRVGRQEGDAGGGGAQQEQGDGQLDFAAEALLDRHEDDGADRPCNKGEGEDGEGVQRALEPVGEREEHRREHQHRSDGVDEEVEIFGSAADHHADGDFARVDVAVAGIDVAGAAVWGAVMGAAPAPPYVVVLCIIFVSILLPVVRPVCRTESTLPCGKGWDKTSNVQREAVGVTVACSHSHVTSYTSMIPKTVRRGLVLDLLLAALAGCNTVVMNPSGDIAKQQADLIIDLGRADAVDYRSGDDPDRPASHGSTGKQYQARSTSPTGTTRPSSNW